VLHSVNATRGNTKILRPLNVSIVRNRALPALSKIRVKPAKTQNIEIYPIVNVKKVIMMIMEFVLSIRFAQKCYLTITKVLETVENVIFPAEYVSITKLKNACLIVTDTVNKRI